MKYENYDPSFPDQPVVDLYLPLWSKLPAFRFKPAFIWVEDDSANENKSSVLTYAQLNDSVQSISSQLLLPLQRSDTVVILCPPGLELVEIIFGCQRAGLLSIPMFPPDPSFAKENYHHFVRVLKQTKPKAAIAHQDYITSVKKYISSSSNNRNLAEMLQKLRWISTDDIKGKWVYSHTDTSSVYNGSKPEEVYLIQYTSGSTGIPKPVLVTAGSAAHNVRTARKAYDLHPNSVIVSWLPQYHDCGLVFLLLTVVCGATCVLTSPAAFVTRPRIWLELITNFKATCTPVPSFTLPLVVKRGGIDKGISPINLWSMRNLILINEPIYKSSVEEFVDLFKPFGLNPSSISPSYGLAENNTFISTAWRSNDSFTSFQNIPSHKKLLPSARLPSGYEEDEDMEIAVVNEDTHELVPDGIEGEIWVSSPSNAFGYLGHPFLSREIFQARLGNISGRCFLRTRDRGIVRGDERFLFVTGRCSDVIKLANNQEIHPHYIETAAYKSCPEYLRGGCLAAFEISRTIAVVAEMQRSEKDTGVLKIICQKMKQAILKEEKVEVGLVILVKGGNVPKTTSGKIQRWAAKDKLIGGKMGVVMEMRFDNNESILLSSTHTSGEGRRRDKTEERNEVSLSGSSHQSRPSLLSLL
ncbi:4-coumarate--coa ligase-like 6 [Melia azedarach]|uniref:4-coumarate--coa ligase-like 6 n=1 Tax=Melia azedarach TaxID=155640 RepID=A0ACC1WSH6_MELAZ|nr:4-coumarate--coa ligase-like 6 [Melia azedarach]